MKEALGCSDTGFPSYANIDGKVYLPCDSRSLNIDDAYGIYILFGFQVIHDSYKILGLS